MRSQAAKLFIQISNLFPPFNGCLQENIKMCQTDHFEIEISAKCENLMAKLLLH